MGSEGGSREEVTETNFHNINAVYVEKNPSPHCIIILYTDTANFYQNEDLDLKNQNSRVDLRENK